MHERQQSNPLTAPSISLLTLNFGIVVSACLHTAVKLKLAEHLHQDARTLDELAQLSGTRPERLVRILRVLTAYGIFQETKPGVFCQTPMSCYLLPDYPGSVHTMILMRDQLYWWRIWELTHEWVQSETPLFELTWGENFWELQREKPEIASLFNQAMLSFSHVVDTALVDAYDFSQTGTVVDIGGGYGSLLACILQRHPHLKGVLFEQPHVLDEAKKRYEEADLSQRCTFVTGNFLETIATTGDCYILKTILHDWDDQHCITILRNCRAAMQAGGRILVIELLNEYSNPSPYPALMNLYMGALFNGKERSAEEFAALYRETGFRFSRAIPTSSIFSLIEGIAV